MRRENGWCISLVTPSSVLFHLHFITITTKIPLQQLIFGMLKHDYPVIHMCIIAQASPFMGETLENGGREIETIIPTILYFAYGSLSRDSPMQTPL